MAMVRPPAVAGLFYPDDPQQLQQVLQTYLAGEPAATPAPKALIAPHAGYIYSGAIAGSAYRLLLPLADKIERVVLLGPAHRVALRGLGVSSADAFATPLGTIPIDNQLRAQALALSQVSSNDLAHLQEHSLEVHLPFLQVLLNRFSLLPLVVGDAQAAEVAEVLESVWGGAETLIVISSDLSHYLTYQQANQRDHDTAMHIVDGDGAALHGDDACGHNPIRGLLKVAKKRGLKGELLDLRNSGDTAGDRDRVVGYGAFSFA
jgi:AmmeMemoRadiSam system protein B